ncbi:hypothetical protein BpHYR1_032864 [Brachionus plicatilis]|uniref:Uncharacterized protein n=1 Tax=Brachionus plicatilis TaxID=10195 RepID=A0A3M7Q244_BRAPC|nr:hypothetical protein BpHYR1_032864 [Brachionus plicatilis]
MPFMVASFKYLPNSQFSSIDFSAIINWPFTARLIIYEIIFRDFDIVQLSKLHQLSGLQNSANLAKIRFQFIQAQRILQRFCTSVADFDIFELCKISEIFFFSPIDTIRFIPIKKLTDSHDQNEIEIYICQII